MTNYIVRRLLLLCLTLFGVTVVIFIVSHSVPVDPVVAVIGEQAADHPEIVKTYREKWGLDLPLPVQYVIFLSNALHGDLGQSLDSHRPVIQDLRDYLPATVELAISSIVFTVLISIPLGVIAATLRGRPFDLVVRTLTLIGVSMPIFWLALVGLDVFYLRLGLMPGPGRLDATTTPPPTVTGLYTVDSLVAGQYDTLWDAIRHLILPALVLTSTSAGLLTRITRSSMLAVLNQDFLRTARSKGAAEPYVIIHHAFPNATIPVVTVVGLAFGDLLCGAVMTETIFGWPGIGRYAYRAATLADFPAIMGVAILVAFLYLLVNLMVDLIYGFIDPRIRVGMR